ncbi:MAG: lactate utilization protein [Rhizobiales bacterium]|nr:lactate utilization protein [Hyphomicrobiales bacterium]
MPTSRDTVLSTIRRSLGVTGGEADRRAVAQDRLAAHVRGVIPARGQLPPEERIALFRKMVAAADGTTTRLPNATDVPKEVAALLRAHNLPMAVRRGDDPRLAALPWDHERTLTVSVGAADGNDLVGLSYAFGAAAESGTLMLLSGLDNPTTLNFLPDTHVVLVSAEDIAGDYESLWGRLRERYGAGVMPRAVNLITGPSRSADIGQTLILGAHGPRRLHVIVVG